MLHGTSGSVKLILYMYLILRTVPSGVHGTDMKCDRGIEEITLAYLFAY